MEHFLSLDQPYQSTSLLLAEAEVEEVTAPIIQCLQSAMQFLIEAGKELVVVVVE
jgi:hypothetical protein